MICPRKELGKLRIQKEDLIALKTDVSTRVRIAEIDHGKICTSETQTWLTRVERVIEKTEIIEAKAKAAKRCQPYCFSRPKLGGRISKLMVQMRKLIEQGRELTNESLAHTPVEIGVRLSTTPNLIGKTTARRSLEMVWDCILNKTIMMIGIYGKSGVGKTEIAKTINNRLLQGDLDFDIIIWITVSQNADVYKLQCDIGAALKLELSSEQDQTKRAGLLQKALKQRKKFVLILDNVPKAFPLHDIGIPLPSKENGCKLLLTTMSRNVCTIMGCQKNSCIEVGALSKDEAWELFTTEFGMALAPDVETVARDVVDECKCLPLEIIKVCGSMRGVDDIREWEVALSDLRNSVRNQ